MNRRSPTPVDPFFLRNCQCQSQPSLNNIKVCIMNKSLKRVEIVADSVSSESSGIVMSVFSGVCCPNIPVIKMNCGTPVSFGMLRQLG